MKVRANNDIYDDGRLCFLKNGVYTVKVELPETYALYMACGEIRIFPKKFFTVVSEGGVV